MKYQKRLLLSGLIAVVLVCFGVLTNWYLVNIWANQPIEAPNPYQELYDELLYPSVKITADGSTGSGVVIRSEVRSGKLEARTSNFQPLPSSIVYILTAAHVVGDEDSVDVTFYYYPSGNSTTITGSVVATDTLKDLALIRTYTYKPYPYIAKLAPRTYQPYIFTPVWVVGCSLGLLPRPTEGIITTLSELSASAVNHWGINAPIWPGNSGGGVFLKETNELIGIAILVKVYQGQLVSTMGSIVTLQDIYEFIKHSPVGLIGHGSAGSAFNAVSHLSTSRPVGRLTGKTGLTKIGGD